jgi:hypothetical protein
MAFWKKLEDFNGNYEGFLEKLHENHLNLLIDTNYSTLFEILYKITTNSICGTICRKCLCRLVLLWLILNNTLLAPSKMLHENKLEMRACSVFLNKLSFDSKSTSEYCKKLRND